MRDSFTSHCHPLLVRGATPRVSARKRAVLSVFGAKDTSGNLEQCCHLQVEFFKRAPLFGGWRRCYIKEATPTLCGPTLGSTSHSCPFDDDDGDADADGKRNGGGDCDGDGGVGVRMAVSE